MSEHGQPEPYYFSPEEDITAEELARALPLLIASWTRSGANVYSIMDEGKLDELRSEVNPRIDELPQKVKRHFKKK